MAKNVIYVVLHTNETSVVLWSPETMDRKYIEKNNLVLGDWCEINELTKTLKKCEPLLDTRVRFDCVEVKAPIVFFSAEKFHDVVGYSPGFGCVGCFIANKFEKDYMYTAWISNCEFSTDINLQKILYLFDVNWLVVDEHSKLLLQAELNSLSYQRLKNFSIKNGVVLKNYGDGGEIYNKELKLCKFKLKKKQQPIPVGTFVQFNIVIDFLFNKIAINVYEVQFPNSIKLLEKNSQNQNLILEIKKWYFDTDTEKIDIPGLCDGINIEEKFSPSLSHNLIIEFNWSLQLFFVAKSYNQISYETKENELLETNIKKDNGNLCKITRRKKKNCTTNKKNEISSLCEEFKNIQCHSE